MPLNEAVTTISLLSSIHMEIADVIQLFNAVFSPIMMLLFGSCFCWFSILTFGLLIMPKQLWQDHLIIAIAKSIENVMVMSLLLFSIRLSDGISKQGKEMMKWLFKILHQCPCQALNEKVNFRLHNFHIVSHRLFISNFM